MMLCRDRLIASLMVLMDFLTEDPDGEASTSDQENMQLALSAYPLNAVLLREIFPASGYNIDRIKEM